MPFKDNYVFRYEENGFDKVESSILMFLQIRKDSRTAVFSFVARLGVEPRLS